MSKEDLYKLRKTELLQIIYEQKHQMNNLKDENANLIKELDNRKIDLKEAGSIAEATLRINKIFEIAQKAADEYLNNVKELNNSKIKNEEKIKEYTIDSKKVEEKELITNGLKKENYKKINGKRESLELIPLNMGLINVKISSLKKIRLFLLIIFERVKILKLKIRKAKISTKKKCNIIKEKLKGIFKIIQKKFEAQIKKTTLFFISKERKINLENYDLSLENIENELKKQKNKDSQFKFARASTYYIIIIIAITIIIVTKLFNVIQISGNSMEPNLYSGDFLIATKIFGYKKGDIIAFYYNNSVLVKRIIATGGDIINIDDEGNVYVNSEKLEENYVKDLSYGNCNITFPFKVPDKEIFVLGDNRESSIDSRNKSIGTISDDKIIGKITININHLILL